jgi:hypothetical protein
MRADMKKVLTERPRVNARYAYSDVRHQANHSDYDDLPNHQGMRRPYHDAKEFSDLLGPLRGFLRHAVGRRWDDVWSEICQVVKSGNTVDQHLRGHVLQDVDIHTKLIDGKVLAMGEYRGPHEPYGLYVDPRDGILCDNDNRPRYKPTKGKIVDGLFYHVDDDGLLYPPENWNPRKNATGWYPLKLVGDQKAMLIEGIWYWIEMAATPASYDAGYIDNGRAKTRRIFFPRYDFVRGETVQEGRYHAGKRQMCSRDLRRHGLRNIR